MADGFEAILNANFLKTLQDADKKMADMIAHSDNLGASVYSAFSKITNSGVLPYVTQLEQKISALNSIKMAIGDNIGMQGLKSTVESAIAELDKLQTALKSTSQYTSEKQATQRQSELNYYQQIIEKIKELERAKAEAKGVKTTLGGSSSPEDIAMVKSAKSAYTEINKELRHYKSEAKEIEKKYEAEIAVLKKQNAIEEFQTKHKLHEAYLAQVKKREQALFNATADSSKGALTYTDRLFSGAKPMTLNNMQTALSKLQDAQRKLNLYTDEGRKKYDQLQAAIKRVQQRIEQTTGASKKLGDSHRNLLNIGDQLGRKLALVFSVSQIQGYIDKMVSVRGEFELQQRALQSILQNKGEANKIWQQTVDLAVRSPFRVGELVKYTKQLAAYRIETDKLHDTTKRLADVSAGLGTDMSRLILAFGQVRAAEYLRGTELRQFTEAGIPMLEELASYFTELEGRAVSTADVFGMISKRMVAFEDVEAVFKRMTDSGGVFYNMQEIQAETLKGQISNLHDSIDLMMNDIGKSYDRVLKGGVGAAKFFIDYWEAISYAIKGVVGMLGMYILTAKRSSTATIELATSLGVAKFNSKGLLTMTSLLKVGLDKLGFSVKTLKLAFASFIPFALIMGAIELVGHLIGKWMDLEDKHKEIEKNYNEQLDKLVKIEYEYNKILAKEKQLGKATEKTTESKRKQLLLLAESLGEDTQEMEFTLKGMDSSALDKMFADKVKLAKDAEQFAKVFEDAFVSNFDTIDVWGLIGENMKEDAEDLNESISKLSNLGLQSQMDSAFKEMSLRYSQLSKEAQGYIDEVEAGQKPNELDAEWLARKAKLLSKIKSAYTSARFGVIRYSKEVNKGLQLARDFEGTYKEMKGEIDDVAKDILKEFNAKSFDFLSKEQKIAFVAKLNESEQLKQLGIATEYIQKYLAEQYFHIDINLDEQKDELSPWQKTFNAKFGDNILTKKDDSLYGFRKITNAAKTQAQVISELQGKYKEVLDTIKRVEKAGDEATAVGGAFEGTDLNQLKNNLKEVKTMLDWFGADYEEKKGKGKQRDIWGERVEAIKGLRKDYEDLIKIFQKPDTIKKVKERNQTLIDELFKDLAVGIEKIPFDDVNSLIKFIETTQKNLTSGSTDWLKLEGLKADLQLQLEVKTAQENRDSFMQKIDSMFGDYEMSLELENLGVPKDLVKKLFNIESIDLSGIREALQKRKSLLRESESEGADEEVKEIDEKLKKVDKLERKDQEERLKKYVKYLDEARDERVKIKLEELRQIAEVEKDNKFTEEQKKAITEKLKTETKQKLDKQAWKDFTGSDFYIELFKDMENASTKTLEQMRKRLQDMSVSLKDLKPEDLKAIVEQINKIDDTLRQRQAPEWQIGTNFKGMVDYFKNRAKWEEELQKTEERRDQNAREQQQIIAKIDSKSLSEKDLRQAEKKLKALKKEEAELDEKSTELNAKLKDGKLNVDDFGAGIKAISSAFQTTVSMINNLNIGMSEGFQDTLEFATSALTATDQMVDGFQAIEDNPKSLGGYVQALSGITSLIGSIFSYKDKRLERQIEEQSKRVEALQRAYEKLEKAIEDAYSVGTMHTYYSESVNNINKQIQSYQEMIALEERKKKTDKDKITEWKNTIEDLREQLKELNEQQLENYGGFGSQANFKSAAEEFANAWFDAYQEVGDGMDALDDTFDDFINNVVKKQLLIRGSQQLLQPLLQMIDNAVADGMVTTKEMAGINEKWNDETKDALNEYYKNIYDMYDGLITGAGELSDLQKGIQSITEPQAAAIEAYLNSIRFYVAQDNQMLTNLYNSLTSTTSDSPIISELKAQTALIRTIDDNLSSVIGKGNSSHSGAYIKVLAK